MRKRPFRNKVGESTMTLPTVVVVGSLFWMLPDFRDAFLWGGLAVAGLLTYLVIEWNNRFRLLRVRSQMTPATFFMLLSVFPEIHVLSWNILPLACLLACYFLLFHAYGEQSTPGILFHAFLFLGIGAFRYPPLLLLVPFLFFSVNAQLHAFSFKGLVAGLIGLLLPYWFYLPYLFWQGKTSMSALYHRVPDFFPLVPDYASVPLRHWVEWSVVVLLGLISISHFVRTYYHDKIRTRQFFYLLLVQEIPLIALTLLFPQDHALLFPLLVLNTTPFISHYFTLARGRGLNIWFCFWLSLVVLIGAANHFDLWTLFCIFS